MIFFQQSTSLVLIAVCLFASVYSALGMRTVYYQDGRVCDVCTDNQEGTVPYKQSYTPEEAGKRVIYSGGQDRINSRPISSPSSSSSYIANRDDYSPRNFYYPFLICLYFLEYYKLLSSICFVESFNLNVIHKLTSFNINVEFTSPCEEKIKTHTKSRKKYNHI